MAGNAQLKIHDAVQHFPGKAWFGQKYIIKFSCPPAYRPFPQRVAVRSSQQAVAAGDLAARS